MTSILSVRTPASSSGVPIVVLVDIQREYLAKPRVTYPWDVSIRHDPGDRPADQLHRDASRMTEVYAGAFKTADWIERSLPRKLGIGKNAGG